MFQYHFAVLFIFTFCCGIQSSDDSMASPKFLYFGYGSNLFSKRILINNPTAVRKGAAKLPGYRLDFNGHAQRWGGAVATIVPDEGRHVWGALWEINLSEVGNLDRQEGVESGVYAPLLVHVESADGALLPARTYRFVAEPDPEAAALLPAARRPSPEYRRIMVLGALETALPADYVQALEAIPHNGYGGDSGLALIPRQEFFRSGPPIQNGQ